MLQSKPLQETQRWQRNGPGRSLSSPPGRYTLYRDPLLPHAQVCTVHLLPAWEKHTLQWKEAKYSFLTPSGDDVPTPQQGHTCSAPGTRLLLPQSSYQLPFAECVYVLGPVLRVSCCFSAKQPSSGIVIVVIIFPFLQMMKQFQRA